MNLGNINESWIKVGIILVACLTAVLIIITIKSSDTYIILPMWFLLIEITSISFKKFTRLSPTSILLCSVITSFIPIFIITVLILIFYNLKDLENNNVYIFLSLAPSIAGILFTYTEAYTQYVNKIQRL